MINSPSAENDVIANTLEPPATLAVPASLMPSSDSSTQPTSPESTTEYRGEEFKLTKPLRIDGADVTELHLDFAKLSAADLVNIEQEMLAAKMVVMKHAAFSSIYCLYIAARASGINYKDLTRLSFLDSDRLVQATQNFMMPSASTD